jgi:hypothetical protein
MYTAVGSVQFSPLWVDGSRSSAGHCCLWPRGAIEGGLSREHSRSSDGGRICLRRSQFWRSLRSPLPARGRPRNLLIGLSDNLVCIVEIDEVGFENARHGAVRLEHAGRIDMDGEIIAA